jgi:dTDP-4-dehydrorhamnose reductase
MAPNVDVTALGRPQLDLEDASLLEDALEALRPDLVVNAAAYTAVDKAEQDAERAFAVNCQGAGVAAAAAAKRGLPFIHLSTDYVYSGHKTSPYEEDDETGPLGVYGHSKLLGEMRVLDEHPSPLILRTSWVYSPFGANFVKTMLRIGVERPVLNVVDDQSGNPTSALDLASAILRIAPGLANGGTYHLSGTGDATWCGLAREIFRTSGAHGGPTPEVRAITTAQYPTPAARPLNSRLSTDAFANRFGFRLGAWQAELEPVVRRLLASVDSRQEAGIQQTDRAHGIPAVERQS